MTGAVWVAPDRLRGAGPRWQAIADALDGARAELTAAMRSEGASWGSDEPGVAFAQAYLPGADSAVDGLRKVGVALRSIAVTMTDTADGFEASDHGFTGSLDSAR